MEVNEIRITTGFALEKDIIHIYAPIYCEEKQPIEKLKEGYLNLFETIKREKYRKVEIIFDLYDEKTKKIYEQYK